MPRASSKSGPKEAQPWCTSGLISTASARRSPSSTARARSCSRAGSSTSPRPFSSCCRDWGDEAQVALEATYGWEWLADLLEEAGYELHLAHPLRTKAIAAARVKTDAV